MARKIEVEITGDSSSLERALSRSGEVVAVELHEDQQGRTGRRSGVGRRFGGAAIVGFKELAEGQKVAAQTSAVLKSTGGGRT